MTTSNSDINALLAAGNSAQLMNMNANAVPVPVSAQAQGSAANNNNSNNTANNTNTSTTPAETAARNQVLMNSLLQQRQVMDQNAQLQTLAALNGFGNFPGGAPDLQQFLMQQKQFQDWQTLALARNMNMMNPMADAMALTFLQQQQQPQQAQPAPNSNAVALSDARPDQSLLLPPDRRRKGRTGTFPQKLHQMLSDLERQEGGTEIASFLTHGRAFSIHKPRDFTKLVMAKYFRMSRFSSFQRQLNLYDFQRITEGPDKGAYFHELFVQGRPILSTMMKRNKIKGVKNLQGQVAAATATASDAEKEESGAEKMEAAKDEPAKEEEEKVEKRPAVDKEEADEEGKEESESGEDKE